MEDSGRDELAKGHLVGEGCGGLASDSTSGDLCRSIGYAASGLCRHLAESVLREKVDTGVIFVGMKSCWK